jgi:hypothetical protein
MEQISTSPTENIGNELPKHSLLQFDPSLSFISFTRQVTEIFKNNSFSSDLTSKFNTVNTQLTEKENLLFLYDKFLNCFEKNNIYI